VLLVMARAMESGGLIQTLAMAAGSLPPWLALPMVPMLSALGGFLTGSVAAANGLFLTFQVETMRSLGLPVIWAVGTHTMLTAAFTAFSPARLVFAAVLTGQEGREGSALRQLWPLIALLLAWGIISLLPGVLGMELQGEFLLPQKG